MNLSTYLILKFDTNYVINYIKKYQLVIYVMKTVEVAGDKTVTNFQNHNYIQHLKKEDKN